ncbi:TIGR01777 family protein [Deferribacter autotrophicus]|uniref:TIGR01777 family protein n=1 Tax=Deferribacter autotrophicus TaxID=500465 RepID=A0A5A8F1U7_9BACT|nr:TIGR01777 family oxidoreductase [Deferribacter autotrophicus]KAA0257397.1 TIGR01777 family protein [Deferribacter autotrophicus]
MKIAISGHRGFIGKNFINKYKTKYEFIFLNRKDLYTPEALLNKIDSADIIINLAGAPILKRWTKKYKNIIVDSRVIPTKNIVAAMSKLKNKPKRFLSASAIGIYTSEIQCDEYTCKINNDFLSYVCQIWENEALKAEEYGISTSILRFGVVLGKNGGTFPRMILPFKLGIGGKIASGKQVISWIHIEDCIRAMDHIIEKNINKEVNIVAPNPVTNYEFTKIAGNILKRPTVLTIPSFILKLVYGEGADILLKTQNVLPKILLESGFKFEFPDIISALKDLLL